MTQFIWSPGMTLETVERHAILQAFRFFRGNKTTTANALGIAIRTLDNKLEKYTTDDKEVERVNDEQRKERESFLVRSRGLPAPGNVLPSAETGVRLESTSEISTQQTVSLSERKEVQELSSKSTAQGHTRKAR